MNALWKKNTATYESSAKVVDGNLIISMPDALNPVVWRMELGSVKASALEVRGHGENGQHMLFLKTPKGDIHDIAPFDTKEKAVNALMHVSAALQSAQGKIMPMTVPTSPVNVAERPANEKDGNSSGYKWLMALGGLLLVIFLFAYLSSLTTPQPVNGAAAGRADTSAGTSESANDVLRGF